MTDLERRRQIEDLCDAALERHAYERAGLRRCMRQRRPAAIAGGVAARARAEGGGLSRNAGGATGGGILWLSTGRLPNRALMGQRSCSLHN